MNKKKVEKKSHKNVGIVGATGLVGSMMRDILESRKFPVHTIRFFASSISAGKTLLFRGKKIKVEDAFSADYSGLDIVLMSAGGDVSKKLAPKIAKKGAIVIDNSSAWRMDKKVPLVVSEVNSEILKGMKSGIIANPNCTTMIAMPVLKPLHKRYGLKELIVSSYQATSGAGNKGVRALSDEINEIGKKASEKLLSTNKYGTKKGKTFATAISYNVIPFAGEIVNDSSRETNEEQKLRNESKKILGAPMLQVSATCVRVPVFTGHSLAIHATFQKAISPQEAETLLKKANGVKLDQLPTPLKAAGGDVTLVGRIRQGLSKQQLVFFVSGDNLRKGAALNAVQIAEVLLKNS